MSTPIEVDRVTRRFGTLTAVDDVSLRVEPGEVVGLIGANGAGKTTLIRVLLGLLAPHAGRVTLAGGPPSRGTRARVGYVPQGLGLWTDLTVDDHLALIADVYPGPVHPPDDREVVRSGGRLVGALPLGLRRRVAFAVARSHRPDVLILDEPTSGVDPLARSRLWEIIHGAADEGAGVLVSTHYLDEASRCDRIVLLSAGRVAAEGTVDELTAGHLAVTVEVAAWEHAWTALEEADLPVLPAGRVLRVPGADADAVRSVVGPDATVTEVPATLEEVFLTVSAG